ncbi:rod shape-determining protein MreC [Lachnospiraceae bacterium NSJ-143]|nr:rod shape-determining protein MreC [Lachnospiraceae bacterium NSJ-143]
MNFFNTYKKQILYLVIALLVVIIFFTAGKKSRATPVDNLLGFIITPAQNISTSVSSWFSNKISSFKDETDIEAENEELKAKVELLEAENKRLSMFEEENRRLSALLDISQKYPDYETTGANIIAKDPGNWYFTFNINKGTKDGLLPNMVLTDAGGLVGRITECGYIYSKVEAIIDSRSSVSAMSLRTGDLGVVKGDYTLMNDGLCRMEYIDAESEIMKGDEIVTSHLSDIFPPGITIGYVKEVITDENGLTKYAVIEPSVDFKHLTTLLVITDSFSGADSDTSDQNTQPAGDTQ